MAIMNPDERAINEFADAEIRVVDEELVNILVHCYLAGAAGDTLAAHEAVNQAQEFLFGNLAPHQIARSIFIKLWPEVTKRAHPMLEEIERLAEQVRRAHLPHAREQLMQNGGLVIHINCPSGCIKSYLWGMEHDEVRAAARAIIDQHFSSHNDAGSA